ncbi:MAG: transcriptional regulator BetI [Acidiferrobacterales bacterium]|nr:transcriptional regulator BetI [Acidiferrobacterales bacterium]
MHSNMNQAWNNSTNRREQLIHATIQTISESGLSGTTVAKVAAKAGLSPGIVNFHFNSKNQLLIDTLGYLNEEYTAVMDERHGRANSPSEKLHAYIEGSFDPRIFVKEKVAVWYAFWSESQARDEYREICGTSDKREDRMIRECFAELLDTSTIQNADVIALALALQGMIDSLWQQALYEDGVFDTTKAVSTCKRFVGRVTEESGTAADSTATENTVDLLPPWTYKNEEFLELEIERLFKPNWMLVGHVSDMPEKGDYLTFEGFGERALIIRNKNGAINAFHNICRHRGSRILEGAGRCPRALICPFHGWRYDLDGKLTFIPGKEGFPYIDPEDHGLVALDLEIWNGFIFVRFVPEGQSLREILLPIEAQVSPYRLDSMKPYENAEEKVYPVNWKVFHDIDNEGYHVPIGHPTLHQLYGKDYVDTSVDGIPVSYGRFNPDFGNLWSVRNYRNLLPEFAHLPEDKKDLWMYFGLFPNLVFALYPDMMEIYMSMPVDLTNTRVISRAYALADDRRAVRLSRYLNRRINKTTDSEDQAYMDTIQEGLNSSVFPRWNLSETAETGVGDFHNIIQGHLPVAKLASQPESGRVKQLNESISVTSQIH